MNLETKNELFKWEPRNCKASFDEEGNLILILDGESILIPRGNDFSQYLGGKWLEEYVYLLFHKLKEKKYDL